MWYYKSQVKPGVTAEIAMLSRQFHKIYIGKEASSELFDSWVWVLYADVEFFFLFPVEKLCL